MGSLEPDAANLPHEVGIVLEATAPTQDMARKLAELSRQPLLHYPIEEWAGSITAFACLLVTIGNNLSSFGTHTHRSELFPTALRARAIGVIYSIDRLTAAFNGYLIGFIWSGSNRRAHLCEPARCSSI